MKKSLMAFATIAATATATLSPMSASAGAIERACLASDRAANNRSLCGCIQQAADLTLSNKDQRQAAKFFKNPQKAQDIRQSDNASHEAFWKRYKTFGETAAQYCG
ncbi:hypothetical protein [Celeribacter halophilus]|uniref:Uncharacterized protein n=1 Tax=Celeribacter halophilus TaxID=576117 RepID=A0A1I3RH92_9RHOB|nr:hypothetical protein [Celeribacter halophilus]PZX12603.1 hypothetical protein LX82_01346 [Celeribacter halophilus]SFJ45933.1 hypothetical protein SAMN04488138_105108 [Celeribacter halophilus]